MVSALTVTGVTILVFVAPSRVLILCGVLVILGGVIGTSRNQCEARGA